MSLTPPLLTERDVQAALARVHRGSHRSLDTVLFARADDTLDERLVLIGEGAICQTFRLRVVTCELALREALDGADRDGLPVVVLTSHGTRLPLDLQAMVARGAIQFVQDEQRVRSRFGDEQLSIASDLVNSPLYRALVHDSGSRFQPVRGRLLTLRHAWLAWLEVHAGLPMSVQMSADQLLAHALSGPPPAKLQRALDSIEGLAAALEQWLAVESGPITQAAWRAWRDGVAREFAALGVVVASVDKPPTATGDEVLASWLGGRLEDLGLGALFAVAMEAAHWSNWRATTRGLLRRLPPDVTDRVLAEADQMLGSLGAAGVRKRVIDNEWLQTAWQETVAAMADALGRLRRRGQPQDWRVAREVFERLKRHRNATNAARGAACFDAARYALRLLGWLQSDAAQLPQSKSAQQQLAELAQRYISDGAWADQLRRRLRLLDGGALADEIQQVLDAADSQADAWNEAFVTGLAAWQRRRRPSGGVLPIERVLSAIAAPFLDEAPHRKLVVVVLDGLSWPKASELLPTLGLAQWGLASWQAKGAAAGWNVPPVLAALPTATEFSRAALFRGDLVPAHSLEPTSRDADRFANHAEMRRFVDRQAGPTLLLGRSAVDSSGQPTRELRALLESGDRVVATVLNVADDQLHGSGKLRARYGLDDIHGLRSLLEICAQAGRALLLCADHGHVLGQRLRTRSDLPHGGAKSRWRSVQDVATAADGELVLTPKEAVWVPADATGVALLYRETDCHHGNVGEGTHGGAGIAEVVAPVVLLSSEDLVNHNGERDDRLQPVETARPSWWEFDRTGQPAPRKGRKKRSLSTTAELPLAQSEAVAVDPTALTSKQGAALSVDMVLEDSQARALAAIGPLLPERKRQTALALLRAALVEGGTVSAARAAHACGIIQHRVAGLVALISERVNVDGYTVVRHDAAQQTVTVDPALLEQLFDPRNDRG